MQSIRRAGHCVDYVHDHAETVAEIASPDGRSKVKLLRRDLGDLRLKQLESEVVVDDHKKRLMVTGNITSANASCPSSARC
jgi:hypothetical protein